MTNAMRLVAAEVAFANFAPAVDLVKQQGNQYFFPDGEIVTGTGAAADTAERWVRVVKSQVVGATV